MVQRQSKPPKKLIFLKVLYIMMGVMVWIRVGDILQSCSNQYWSKIPENEPRGAVVDLILLLEIIMVFSKVIAIRNRFNSSNYSFLISSFVADYIFWLIWPIAYGEILGYSGGTAVAVILSVYAFLTALLVGVILLKPYIVCNVSPWSEAPSQKFKTGVFRCEKCKTNTRRLEMVEVDFGDGPERIMACPACIRKSKWKQNRVFVNKKVIPVQSEKREEEIRKTIPSENVIIPLKQTTASNSVNDLARGMHFDAEAFKHRKIVSKREQPDDNDYGFVMTNPVCTSDEEGEIAYLTRLRTLDGKAVKWRKNGSYKVQGEEDSKPVKINKYQLYLEDNPLADLFLCPFGFCKDKAPNGFTLLARDFESEEEKPKTETAGNTTAFCTVSPKEIMNAEECNAVKPSYDKTVNHPLSVPYRNYDDRERQLLCVENSSVSAKNKNVQNRKMTKGKKTAVFILVIVAALAFGCAYLLWGKIMDEREGKPIQTEIRKQVERNELKYTSVTLTEIYSRVKSEPIEMTGRTVEIEGYAYVISPEIIVVTQSSKFDDFGNGSYSGVSNGYRELKNRIIDEPGHYFEVDFTKDGFQIKSGDYVYAKGKLEFTRNALDTGYKVCIYATEVVVK